MFNAYTNYNNPERDVFNFEFIFTFTYWQWPSRWIHWTIPILDQVRQTFGRIRKIVWWSKRYTKVRQFTKIMYNIYDVIQLLEKLSFSDYIFIVISNTRHVVVAIYWSVLPVRRRWTIIRFWGNTITILCLYIQWPNECLCQCQKHNIFCLAY